MSGAPETIHQRGRAALLGGRELHDVPPAPGGSRWGLSLVVRPDPAAADRLGALATEAAGLAGPGQWVTGARDSSHLTVTYLERTHRAVGRGDPRVRRFVDVVRRVAAGTPTLRWHLVGLAVADRGILALAEPADPAPDAFRGAVLRELGELGAAEACYRRSVWWVTLLHFAAPVADPVGLAAWVERRRRPLGPVQAAAGEVVRYEYDGARTVPVPLACAALTGVREEVPDGSHA